MDEEEEPRRRRWRRRTATQIRGWITYYKYFIPPELEAWNCDDLIQQVRNGGSIVPFDGDMPQPDSHDSYNQFARHNKYLCLSWEELKARGETGNIDARLPTRAAKLQAEWEAEQAAKQARREAAADAAWKAAEAKRAVTTGADE